MRHAGAAPGADAEGAHAGPEWNRVPGLDVLVTWNPAELPSKPEALELLRRIHEDLEWGCLDARVTVLAPARAAATLAPLLAPAISVRDTPETTLRSRFLLPGVGERDLLLCTPSALPGANVIGRLRETLATDPMFGAVAPRLALMPEGNLLPLGLEPGAGTEIAIPRDRLSELEDVYVLPECLFPCLLLRRELLAALEPPEPGYESLEGALLEVLHRARRRGFRIAVDNRAVVFVGSPEAARVPPPPLGDLPGHGGQEAGEVWNACVRQQLRGCALEPLLAAAGPRRAATPPLLLDCTGMGEVHNGTSASILGLLDGIHCQDLAGWRISVLARRKSQHFFGLRARYPRFRVTAPEDGDRHAVALRLSQVWSLATWADLHSRALSVAVSILDTIAVDIMLHTTADFVQAFQFTGEHADGLMYISKFSRERFRRRFPVSPEAREIVHYLSFSNSDHVVGTASPPPGEAYVLIIGNDYDHKDVRRTATLLADAFPFQKFRALGLGAATRPSVKALPSGLLPDEFVEEQYANCTCIVYPSLYEGFGLPVVKGLNHGKTVIARRSALLEEIAEHVPRGGRLLDYATSTELIEALGSVLHGLPRPEVPLGAALHGGRPPLSWGEIGAGLLRFARTLAADWDVERWRRRNAALSYARYR